jgi:hypothetical protein
MLIDKLSASAGSFPSEGYLDTVKEKRGYLKIGFISPRGIK